MSDILRPIIAMQVAVHQLREREDGQTTTEYALFFLRGVLRSLFADAASSVSARPASRCDRGWTTASDSTF
jgi:hypothetical protein